MKKYSANYAWTNNNFIIKNLDGEEVESKFYSSFCIVYNLIQRGAPTLATPYLQEALNFSNKNILNKENRKPLIS